MRRLGVFCVVVAGLVGAPGALAAPHRPVCPGPAAAGSSRCLAHVITDGRGVPRATSSPVGYGPAQFHGAYTLPTTSTSSGQTIAIVDAYDDPTIRTDLTRYDSALGIQDLPTCSSPTATGACFVKVNQNGQARSYPKANAGWALEISLDVETAHEICGNCKVVLVEANSSATSNLDAAEDTAVKLQATEISNSWGTNNEYSGEVSENTHFNHPGVAITVASGDNGYNAFGFPAASPDVIAVGGTTLSVSSSTSSSGTTYGWAGEIDWSGTGSGCSLYMSAQSWQTSALGWPNTGCQSARGVADVAADADPNTGAAVYDTTKYYGQAGWFQVGGTSLASPLIAAVYALAGNASGTQYPASIPYAHPASLHDVASGLSTGNCTSMCLATLNYDGPTGVGTPNGTAGF